MREEKEEQVPEVEGLEINCPCGEGLVASRHASKRKPEVCKCGRRFWWKKVNHAVAAVKQFKHVGQMILLMDQ